MIRTRIVQPDTTAPTVLSDGEGALIEGPPLAVVSQQALGQALLDAVVVLDLVGGHLAVTTQRARTGFGDERRTVYAMIEIKDRTTDARPQHEDGGARLVDDTPPAPAPAREEPPADELEPEPHIGDDGVVRHAEESVVTIGPGGEEIDESSIPPHLRGQ